jgi:hypothetical protein
MAAVCDLRFPALLIFFSVMSAVTCIQGDHGWRRARLQPALAAEGAVPRAAGWWQCPLAQPPAGCADRGQPACRLSLITRVE